MNSLRSEKLSKRLYWAMSIIILCLLLICIPLIFSKGQSFLQSVKTYHELETISSIADLANQISRERAPANKAMSSSPSELAAHQQELMEYRLTVDAKIKETAEILKEHGFDELSTQLIQTVQPSLARGRAEVDRYVALPYSQRNAEALDHSVLAMFDAWESSRNILKEFVITSKTPSPRLTPFITQILLLSDLRDQSGRVASNIMAHVTFGKYLPDENLTRSLQTQRQVVYLWDLVDTLQPKQDKTPEFVRLHQDIQTQFIEKGIPIVSDLIDDSIQHRPYRLTGTQLTENIVDKFATVIKLQTYLIDYSTDLAQREMQQNLNYLLWSVAISLISVLAAVFSMVFARRSIFLPLIAAREILFDLSKSSEQEVHNKNEQSSKDETETLFAAIQKLERMLQQRDALEFRLKNIAHSDSLTGLSNRFALEEYTKFLEEHPSKFTKTCLMIIDIDHFKQVNDQHGHIVGDQVIQSVADCLKWNVRTSDMIVRYGGDEFLVLIENIELVNALNVANKIRKEVNGETILDGEGQRIPFSVSIGVAVGADSWLELFAKADSALFEAKAKGRNVVEAA
ncbi:diguanylate cyclase [Acinetobacter sp. NCu2D-2]|uniref:GGDEF domain-containing protein n=1 Tax=Acinetobacter sp. NCu2D-2 TaxID=1608473 RepID=UPI0007CDAFA0|nr:GGDEF domain-containing protein [Acinetobacter sp. NCu2D-2]ANF80793.1 diguanylate cyclase [Acinetobacter sp. NCu2D-2]